MSYLFFLGQSPELASSELHAFFKECRFVRDRIIEIPEETFSDNGDVVPIEKALTILGGTVKIARILTEVPEIQSTYLARLVGEHMTGDGKCTFGISTYDVPDVSIPRLTSDMKDLLTHSSHPSVRFINPQEGTILSAVAVAKQKVIELNIVKKDQTYLIAQTVALQQFDDWSMRDYGRPHASGKSGMLPPKVSRMAVNLALGSNSLGKKVLDPFCGMGTIVGEALLRGATATGSDISEEVITCARENDQWLRSKYPDLPESRYVVSDATHIHEHIAPGSIDAIVTEPYLGPSGLGEGAIQEPEEVKNIIRGLEKLYIGCLREWHPLLINGGCIVIALPEIQLPKTKYFVKKVVDRCETLGYTSAIEPLAYSRPMATVRRMFYKIRKNT